MRIKCNAKPYEGKESYIFFSYSHEDECIAYPLIERMARRGFRVWYDSGLHPGDDWPEVIAAHLQGCTACVILMTEHAMASHNCKNELNYAVESHKLLVPILYDNIRLSLGIRLQLSSCQQFKCSGLLSDEILEPMLSAEAIQPCKGHPDPNIVARPFTVDYVERERWVVNDDLLRRFVSWPKTEVEGPEPASVKLEPMSVQPEPVAVQPESVSVRPEPMTIQHTREMGELNLGTTDFDDSLETTVVDEIWEDDDEKTITSAKESPPVIINLLDGSCYRGKPGTTRIGRGSTSDVRVFQGDRTVGREHACLSSAFDKNMIQDLNSVNGTRVNGIALKQGETVEVGTQVELYLAQHGFYVAFGPIADLVWQAGALASLRSEKTGEAMFMFAGSVELGRSYRWKSGAMSAPNIGHKHATLRMQGDRCMIEDHSRNGTYVNSSRIPKGQPCELAPGDRVRMGDESFTFNCLALEKR